MKKFKEDPPQYRIHMMQGLAVKLTIYMILFACIYAVSVGFWIFALILLPVGTIGNYYSMKSHFIRYKASVKTYELAKLLKPIEEDISYHRRKWRIIEKQIGFFGIDIIFFLFTAVLCYAYFADISLYWQFGIVVLSIIPLYMIYFVLIYKFCEYYYSRREDGKESI